MTVQDDATSGVKETGTVSKSGTPLTQAGSLSGLRSRLRVKRNQVGADTPLGYHISNLIEQMWNYEEETNPDAKAHLERFMAASVAAIENLSK